MLGGGPWVQLPFIDPLLCAAHVSNIDSFISHYLAKVPCIFDFEYGEQWGKIPDVYHQQPGPAKVNPPWLGTVAQDPQCFTIWGSYDIWHRRSV